MPSQSEVNPKGPQNILTGAIKLNGVVVHEGWAQFDAESVYERFSKIVNKPVT